MSGRGKRGHGVQYVQNEEPAFIRQFKEKIGYKEGPDVDTKRQRLEFDDDDDENQDSHDDEKPVVVVLKEGDLTAEEFEKMEESQRAQEEPQKLKDDKILFTKPTKKDGDPDKKSELTVTSSSKPKKEGKKDKKSSVKEVRNSNLLSFGDEDEDDT